MSFLSLVILGVLLCRPAWSATWFVQTSGSNSADGTSWGTAKLTIQAAVDVAAAGDVVLVGDGTYSIDSRAAAGATLPNRLVIDKALTVQSVNGPGATVIEGEKDTTAVNGNGLNSVRCVWIADNAILDGFTLRSGSTYSGSVPGSIGPDGLGGGVYAQSTLAIVRNCVLSDNAAFNEGGGAYSGTLIDCEFLNNTALRGAGMAYSSLDRCLLTGNAAEAQGGGSLGGTLNNCRLSENTAGYGGGSYEGVLTNCTLTGNDSDFSSGGSHGGAFFNCVVYGNIHGEFAGGSFEYSCSDPAPPGPGNIGVPPQFVGANDFSLTANSPCIGAGNNTNVSTLLDLVGAPRIHYANVDMGAYEYSGAAPSPATRYVNQTNATPRFPYTSLATAAVSLQNAVDVAHAGDRVIVSDGIFSVGTRTKAGQTLPNRLLVEKAVQIESVNGASATLILGEQDPVSINGVDAVRCVWLASGASLSGFTLTGGATRQALNSSDPDGDGGGVFAESETATLTNCIVSANAASDDGGGAYGGTHVNSLFVGNSAAKGGGVSFSQNSGALYSCTLTDNTAAQGGGAYLGVASNCILIGNRKGSGAIDNYAFSSFNSSCTVPLPPGADNIALTPLFVGGSDYRLSASSPCIDAGSNASLLSAADLDGAMRISNDTVDMGAYEYSGPPNLAATRYVNAGNPNPAFPYTSWSTAALTIQDAVDAALIGDTVIVTNGVYATGSRARAGWTLANRLLVEQAIRIESVNGPEVTFIQGAQHPGTTFGTSAVRCVWLASGASLRGFTLSNGATEAAGDQDGLGGGLFADSTSATVSHCIVSGNSAANAGGGTYSGFLDNCLVTGNYGYFGGGSRQTVMVNCTVAANTATFVGGVLGGAFTNCIVFANTDSNVGASNYDEIESISFAYSCTTPLPSSGAGNIDDDPLFVSASDFHLSGASPCFDVGTNAAATAGTDLQGYPRIVFSTVDMGAYERQTLPVLSLGAQGGGGTTTGSGSYFPGTSVEISVTPLSANWLFTGWNDGDTNLVRTIVMPGDSITYIAEFTRQIGPVTAYVSQVSSNPVYPYADWATAATNIQDAVDVLSSGDVVVVGDGIYDQGGRSSLYGSTTNRLLISHNITVKSLNGPAVTEIRGAKDPITTNGLSAVRCVWMNSGGVLSGFTLSNGATSTNGLGGGSYGGTLIDCILVGNSAGDAGGGSYNGVLTNCTLSGNTAIDGGGASSSTLTGCVISNNLAYGDGGGAHKSTLTDCTIAENTANDAGGGAFSVTMTNCRILNNDATYSGGAGGSGYIGAQSTLYNCTVTGNTAADVGGGTGYGSVLYNCTLTGNAAGQLSGGSHWGTLYNCIVVNNSAPNSPNYNWDGAYGSIFRYSCTTPLPPGAGNITENPGFIDAGNGNLRLSASSPCIDSGNNGYVRSATDADGNTRVIASTVDMGAYEAAPGVEITVAAVNGAGVGSGRFFVGSNTVITAVGTNAQWSFVSWNDADTNQVRTIVVPETDTTYTATFVNDILTPVTAYVDVNNSNPVWPYTSWATAATNIQEAIDILSDGDRVWVTNGVYEVGGRVIPGQILTNRVIIAKAIAVQSVNGPDVTFIRGAQDPVTTNGFAAVRGVWMAGDASLSGFTVTQGATMRDGGSGATVGEFGGGGIHAVSSTATISNCVLTANVALYRGGGATGGTFVDCVFTGNQCLYGSGGGVSSAGDGEKPFLIRCTLQGNYAGFYGGGASGAALDNCALLENSAGQDGGGAYAGSMTNCTVVANSAVHRGGGVGQVTVRNSIIYYNTSATTTLSNIYSGSYAYSCVGGISLDSNNIDLDPQFVDLGSRNLRLSPSSPCRNVGDNAASTWPLDLDRNARIFNVDVDMGAYESQEDSSPVYVDIGNSSPVFPYNSWMTAATNIQDGVDAATLYATVFVSNGVYQIGGRLGGPWNNDNRVYIDKPIDLVSMNGPEHTVIVGGPSGEVRCVAIVTEGSSISGFTLTNGHAIHGGGVFIPRGVYYSPAIQATVSNCVLTANVSSGDGGGAYGGTLIDCTLTANMAVQKGGGAVRATLINCTLDGNSAQYGGGASESTLTDCLLFNNVGGDGGGAIDALLISCTLTNNTANNGGGALQSTLNDCTLTGNTATYGGGTRESTLLDCTLSGNSADRGGGSHGGALTDCLLSNNSATLSGGGTYEGTMTNCTLSGNSALEQHGGGADRATLIGCALFGNSAQWGGGASSTTLTACTLSNNTAFVDGGGVNYSSLSGCTLVNNVASNSGGGSNGGSLINCSLIGNSAGSGGGSLRGNLTDCFLSGNTATNYGGGSYLGTLTGCTLSGNVAGVGGGGALGSDMNDCLITGNSAGNNGGGIASAGTLNNCEIVGNTAAVEGGGTTGGTLNNCRIFGNVAGQYGGGALYGTLNNCVLEGNSAGSQGGGAWYATLTNCTVSGNRVTAPVNGGSGAGVFRCTLRNSIVQFNTNVLTDDVENYYQGTITHSFVTPLPAGAGNFTNNPQFVSGSYRLSAGSPCRDSGSNALAPAGADLDGNSRIVHGFVDVGAYEYQGGTEQADFDGDGMGNGDEAVAGTDFTDRSEVFEIALQVQGQIVFSTALGRLYSVEFNDDLAGIPQVWTALINNVPGTGNPVVIQDPAAASLRHYRGWVQPAP